MQVTPIEIQIGQETNVTFTINYKKIPSSIAPGVASEMEGELFQLNPNGTKTKIAEFSDFGSGQMAAKLTQNSKQPENLQFMAQIWNQNGWAKQTALSEVKSVEQINKQNKLKSTKNPDLMRKNLDNLDPKDYNFLKEICHASECCLASIFDICEIGERHS